jgi:hypothetical protein
MSKRPAVEPSSNIYRIKCTPAVYLGRVRAVDDAQAITAAIEQFKIGEQPRNRLIAQRTG